MLSDAAVCFVVLASYCCSVRKYQVPVVPVTWYLDLGLGIPGYGIYHGTRYEVYLNVVVPGRLPVHIFGTNDVYSTCYSELGKVMYGVPVPVYQ